MAATLDCNLLAQVALELQMKFENCSVLNAEDLDKLVDLIMSVGECITVGQFNQNNILEKIDLTPYENIDAVSISDRVNALPLFTVNEDRLFFFNSFERDNNLIESEVLYALKVGKGVYGTGSTVTLTDTDFIRLGGGSTSQNDINIIEQTITTIQGDITTIQGDILDILNNLTTLLTNVGGGVELYKNYDTVTEQHSFRTLKSSDNTVDINIDGDTVDVKLITIPNIAREFYITGDGQTNPVVFNTGFDGGLVSTTRTFLKDVGGHNYYRVEIRGQISVIAANAAGSNTVLYLPVGYRPITGDLPSLDYPIKIGNITRSTLNGYNNLQVFFNYAKNEAVVGEIDSETTDSYVNICYVSSDRSTPIVSNSEFQIGIGSCVAVPTSWSDVYSPSLPDLVSGDILYSDPTETTPFNGGDSLYQVRRTNGLVAVGSTYNVSTTGVVSNASDCGAFFQAAYGSCSDGTGENLTWQNVYIIRNGVAITDGPQIGDKVYSDSGYLMPFAGDPVRLRNNIALDPLDPPLYGTLAYSYKIVGEVMGSVVGITVIDNCLA